MRRPLHFRRRKQDGKGLFGCFASLGCLALLAAAALAVCGVFGLLTLPALLGGAAQAQADAQKAKAADGANADPMHGNVQENHPGSMQAGGSYNVGQPDPATLGQGHTFSGAAAIDWDGDPHAYAPPGSGLVGDDNLANAGHPGNWWGIQTDTGQPDGTPLIGPDGYYISTTSARFSQDANGVGYENTHGGTYLDASTTNYVALPSDSHGVTADGARPGDYVMVTNNSTGQSTWAVYGDSRGSNNDGVEMSAATATAVGVGYNRAGTTSNAGNITVTVYPGSRNTGKPGGG